MQQITRTRWAAIGAAVAVSVGAGGVGLGQAAVGTGDKPVYVALDAPCRLVDTRPDSRIGPKNTPIAAGDAEAYEIQVTGENGHCAGALAVPAGARAVAANITAIAPMAGTTGRSYFTVYPADTDRPTTSNLNFLDGAPPVPNKVDVGLSTDGKIRIYNHEGTAHAAVDVFGYYIDHHHDDRYFTEVEVDAAVHNAKSLVAISGSGATVSIGSPPYYVQTDRVVQTVTLDTPVTGSVVAHGSSTVRGTEPDTTVTAGCSIEFDSGVVDGTTDQRVDVAEGEDAVVAVVGGLHGVTGAITVNLVCKTYGGEIFPTYDPNEVDVIHPSLVATFAPD